MTLSKEDRINEIIADICDASRDGHTPSRFEILKQYPEFESELVNFLDDLNLFSPLYKNPCQDFKNLVTKSDFAPGNSIKKYTIREMIGHGGIGVVYRAFDNELKRDVALKIIHKDYLSDPISKKRFEQEVESTAKLEHPNIVKIYDYGYSENHGFIAMQLIKGEDLSTKLKSTTIFPHESAQLIKKLASAIEESHKNGILHRDIKPGNILLSDDNTPYLTDFGLALNFNSNQSLTNSDQLIGTPRYMAPEQANSTKGKKLTHQIDIYSLGVVLYQCLTGKPPFDSINSLDLLNKIIHEDPTIPRKIRRNIPQDIEAICLKCLEKNPKSRYSCASHLESDLRRFLNYESTEARPLNGLQLTIRRISSRKKRRVLVSCILLMLFICPLLIWSLNHLLILFQFAEISKFENFILNVQSLSQREPGPSVLKFIEDQKSEVNLEEFKSSIVLNHLSAILKKRTDSSNNQRPQYPQVLHTLSESITVSKNENHYLGFNEKGYSLFHYPSQNLIWKKDFQSYILEDQTHNYYVADFDWSPDSNILYIATTNSHQRENYLYKISVNDGEVLKTHIFSDSNKIVNQLEVSPDGEYLYIGFKWRENSSGLKGGFKILSANTFETVIKWQDLNTYHHPGTPIVFDRFKNEVLINDNPKTKNANYRVLRRWSLDQQIELEPYYIELSYVSNLHLSQSGEYLAVSLRDKQRVNFYNLKSKNDKLHSTESINLQTLGTNDPWNRPTESAHPTQISCSMSDGWIQIFDAKSGDIAKELYLSADDFGIEEFNFTDLLVGKNAIWVQFNTHTLRYPKNIGTKLLSHNLGSVTWNLGFNPDSNMVITGNEFGELRAWNLQNQPSGLLSLTLKNTVQLKSNVPINSNSFYAISPSGSYLFVSPKDGIAYLEKLNPSTLDRKTLTSLTISGRTNRAFCSPDESKIAVVNFDNRNGNDTAKNLIHLFEIQGQNLPENLEPIKILSPESLKLDQRISHDLHIRDLSFSPDSTLLALAPRNKGENNNRILIFDWQSRSVIKQLQHLNSKCTAISFSKDSKYLSVAQLGVGSKEDFTRGSLVETWETKTWSKIDRFEPGLIKINCLQYSPDNSRVLTLDKNGNIEAWLAPKYYPTNSNIPRRPLNNFGPIKGEACWLQFTADGNTLIVVGGEPSSDTPFPTGVLAVYFVGE